MQEDASEGLRAGRALFPAGSSFFRAGTYPGRREAFFVLTRDRPPARSLVRFASDFPRQFPAARALPSETWEVVAAMRNVMQPPICIAVGNTRYRARRWCT